jgi:hypothetical protein
MCMRAEILLPVSFYDKRYYSSEHRGVSYGFESFSPQSNSLDKYEFFQDHWIVLSVLFLVLVVNICFTNI